MCKKINIQSEREGEREREKNIRELNNQKYENIKPAKVFINAHTTHTHTHSSRKCAVLYRLNEDI